MAPATLNLVLERRAEDIHEPEFAAYTPLVGFEAFLSAQRVFGWVRLDADRLTDLLNAHELLHLENVHVEDLREGSTIAADETLLPRSEIIAVIASGPRGRSGSPRDDTASCRSRRIGHLPHRRVRPRHGRRGPRDALAKRRPDGSAD